MLVLNLATFEGGGDYTSTQGLGKKQHIARTSVRFG
jgi:hypothetical protein